MQSAHRSREEDVSPSWYSIDLLTALGQGRLGASRDALS